MSGMIEHVAQALARESGVSDWSHVSEHGDYDSRDYWRRLARSAIEEMIEPTFEMREAAWMASRHAQPFCRRIVSERAWEAAIEAALTPTAANQGKDG